MRKVFILLSMVAFMQQASSQNWLITGNSGTNPSTNFLGTTDNKALVFKTNNFERIRIVPGGKVGIGLIKPAQELDVKGNINIGSGFALYMENHPVFRVDSINQNTFLGNGAAPNNTTGFYNTATGYYALFSNTSGGVNTATGSFALLSNTTGGANTATGTSALQSNTIGYSNTATGTSSLYYNSSGYQNTASGYYSLYSNITGYS